MFQLLAYNVTAGVNDANVDMTAAVDPNFSRRNSHYILSERYNLIGAFHHGASVLRARLNVPSLNGFFRHTIYPVNRSADIPTNPQIQDLRDAPIELPMNEEIAVEESGNLGAATEVENTFLWIAPPAWSRTIPRGIMRATARFTATITVNAAAWSADAAITFAENLKGGIYAVVGGMAQANDLLAFRLNFPKPTLYSGRKLLPGDLGLDAIGNVPPLQGRTWLGEWGRFHTFEPPQISVFSLTGGGTAVEGRLELVYLGDGIL